MANVLKVRNLEVVIGASEGKIFPVRDVSFRVPAGKTVALVGESGSGKSVIAQSIMGILPKVARIAGGEILFFDPKTPQLGVDLAKMPPNSRDYRALRGGRLSIIFQEPMTALSPLHTVGNQISEALSLHHTLGDQMTEALQTHKKLDQAQAIELTREMLRLVGFPDPARAISTYPFELSGGLRQRAVIAMALICRPALLIADEPTTALDVTIQAQILKLIQDLQKELGMAVMIITHDLGVVANVADEVVVLYHGKVMEAGTVEQIFEDPQHPYLKALLKAVPRFNMLPGERLVPIREINHQQSKMIEAKAPWPAGADFMPLIEARNISKSFAIRKTSLFGISRTRSEMLAVDDVSFSIKRGECLGLVGESGCGKTTTSKMLLRALNPDSGQIHFNDRGKLRNLADMHGDELFNYRRKVQFVFQDPFSSLNPRMTVFDIICEPLVIHKIGDAEERAERVIELMRLVGLDPRFLRRYPHSFSGGQRQRIGIARALALQPELLICDEPVSALDVSIQAQVLNLLKDLQKEMSLTYLFISHNLAVIDYMADRIIVMCRGRLVESAPRDLLFQNPIHPYTKALLAAVPKPELGDRLDLAALMDGKCSVPEEWPAPFTIRKDLKPGDPRLAKLVDLGGGHQVRAFGNVNPASLVAA